MFLRRALAAASMRGALVSQPLVSRTVVRSVRTARQAARKESNQDKPPPATPGEITARKEADQESEENAAREEKEVEDTGAPWKIAGGVFALVAFLIMASPRGEASPPTAVRPVVLPPPSLGPGGFQSYNPPPIETPQFGNATSWESGR
eukprot:Hpha_TRINITY_DN18727_c0_g1::TRINITY_DN18727_c0_g1_i1::g.47491::m.47491